MAAAALDAADFDPPLASRTSKLVAPALSGSSVPVGAVTTRGECLVFPWRSDNRQFCLSTAWQFFPRMPLVIERRSDIEL